MSDSSPQLNHADLVSEWVQAMKAGILNGKPYSERTIGDYNSYLVQFFKRHQMLSRESIKQFMLSLPTDQFATREKAYKAIVCFAKYLIMESKLDGNILDSIKNFRPKRNTPPKREVVKEADFQNVRNFDVGLKNKLILELIYNCGIRATELCFVKIEDVDVVNQILSIKHAKGGKQRKVGINKVVTDLLIEYLATVNTDDPTKFLLTDRHGKQMSRHGISKRVRRAGKLANVKTSPHALRRSFATNNARKGRPLTQLQLAMGHSNIQTTRNYCITTEEEVIDAMKEW